MTDFLVVGGGLSGMLVAREEARELRETMAGLGAAGFTQLVVQITPGQDDAVADWAKLIAT